MGGSNTKYEEERKRREELEKEMREKDARRDKEEQMRKNSSLIRSRLKQGMGKHRQINVIVFGATGHGKSTLCNSLMVAMEDDMDVQQHFSSGSSELSYTKMFQMKSHGYFNIIDMFGIHEAKDITKERLRCVLRGTDEQLFRDLGKTPGVPIEIQMVVIVLRYQELSMEVRELINVANELVQSNELKRRLVITHVDEIDPQLDSTDTIEHALHNIKVALHNIKVKQAVKEVADAIGVPKEFTHVLRNYHGNAKPDDITKNQHLTFLDLVLKDAFIQINRNDDKRENN